MAPTHPSTVLLSRAEVTELLSTEDAVAAVRDVFRAHGHGQVVMPPKISLDLRPLGPNAWHNAMPAYVAPRDAAGIKWAGGYQDNPRQGLPYVMAVIVLQDPETGYPMAIMDGIYITAIRTGAVAAVCVELYGRQDNDRTAFIGAGDQARTTLAALMVTRPPVEIAAFDVARDRAAAFADEARARYGIAARATDTVEEAVRSATNVVTATPADEPLVAAEWIEPGATIVSIGSFQELDDAAVLGADKIIVDSWEQCAHRGELKRFAESGRLGRDDVFAEIGETAAGSRPGRESDEERILVVPIGLGSHDIALARVAFERAGSGRASRFDFLSLEAPDSAGETAV